jgi:hypothetical protein
MWHVEDTKRKGKKNAEDFVLKSDENKVEKEETRRRLENKNEEKIPF